MHAPTECLRCRGSLSVGVILDRGDHNVSQTPQWVDGIPERSFWSGLKTKGHEAFKVVTYRCDRCGYLESYATEAVAK